MLAELLLEVVLLRGPPGEGQVGVRDVVLEGGPDRRSLVEPGEILLLLYVDCVGTEWTDRG